MNNFIIIVMDSCRYDSFIDADPKNVQKLGTIEKRYSYASWTAPSHYNLLMGLMPHTNPTGVYASEYYKQDLIKFSQRLGISKFEGFRDLAPSLWLPTLLKKFGYRTSARVSMPVLNPCTPLNLSFDEYQLMSSHNDFGAIIDTLVFDSIPRFYLINTGETHYPYAISGDDTKLPRISGFHGVVKHIGDSGTDDQMFDADALKQLHDRQIVAAKHIDTTLEKLFNKIPFNTWIVVMSDHGELFGECGFFGHGPICHQKVFEVPFVEGML